jgi:putative ABC transport system permease protein
MTALWQDIRFGLRMLARSPGFTVIVVVILGIGIGATTAMLSTVDAALFRPCPYRDSERLAWLAETDPGRTHGEMVSLPNFYDWREQNHLFEQLAAANPRACVVRDAGRTERSDAMSVSEGFFSVLGVQPMLGRLFLSSEERPGGPRVVILSESQWQNWFARDPNAIGKMLIVDGVACTVVGVLPGEFRWVFRRQDCGLWLPMALESVDESHRRARGTDVIGRLKPGVRIDQAQAEMDVIANRLARAHPEALADVGILVVPMNEAYRMMVGRTGNVRVLMILLGIVGSVLLMACLHVAGLLLARATAREREMAVRAALGAHRLRLVRQLLTESVLVAGLGGGVGLLLAHWGVRVLAAVGGDLAGLIPWFVEPRIDSRSLLYALLVSLATCALFGALPAVWISRIDLSRFLTAGRTSGQGPHLNRLRAALVMGDLAVAFVLLVMAALVVNTYVHILDFAPGIDAQNVLAMDIELDTDAGPYSVLERRSAFFQQVLEGIQRLPGVRYAATANTTPAWTGYNYGVFRLDDHRDGDDQQIIRRTTVSPEYFHVLRIPLLKGRTFTEHEAATGAPVAIINESLAARSWPGQDPIGKHLLRMNGASQAVSHEIVGVVADVNHYFHFLLAKTSEEDRKNYVFPDDVVYVPGYDRALMVRAQSDPAGMAAAIRRTIFAVDPDAVPSGVVLLQDDIDRLFWLQRFNMVFFGAFAAVTLLLGSMGVYGAVAHSVSRRTHDIGIHMALGAGGGDVLKAVLREGLGYILVGLTMGLAAALVLTRLIASLLYEIRPTDPLTFACAALVLTGAALSACYLPARRATRIDPMAALRCE